MEQQRTFDRVVQFDEKSRDFPIRALVGNQIPRSYTWRCDTWLDQGSEGACVGFGWSHELAARPVVLPVTNDSARNIYHEAQKVDEWPGESYSGTSVLAGAKVLNSLKLMDEYRWAFSTQDAILAVGYKGPVVCGFNWWTGMMNMDSAGFLRPTGNIEGGHCILVLAIKLVWKPGTSITQRQSGLWFNFLDLNKSYFTVHNSWGKTWGYNGEAKISVADFQALQKDQGEVCIPVRRGLGE